MPKIHLNGLIFSFTPITIKPHTVKVYMKSINFSFTSFLEKSILNMQMSSTLGLNDLARLYGQKAMKSQVKKKWVS